MRRLFFDTDAVDAIATLPGLYQELKSVLSSGTTELILTHVQIDQIAVMADKKSTDDQRDKRGRVLALVTSLPNVRIVATAGFVVGLSRLDVAKLDDQLGEETREGPEFARNKANIADVLLVNTAVDVKADFVSFDHKARNYARSRGLSAITPKQLLMAFESDP
jgi:hypothetical protein